ncbi:MAG: aldolase/citrate lyase family protein [Lachnospiraceae bacterium]
MPLKLMYITNIPEIAQIAESAGVDRIFVDMEFIGKDQRQAGLNTVKSHHKIADIHRIRQAIEAAELLVRINPIHNRSDRYGSSKEEIDEAIENGADILMLPYFKTAAEVGDFIRLTGGRAKTMLLLETPEAVTCLDDILSIDGIDEMFIGLNDLSLGYGKQFMFELLADGTVEELCYKFKKKRLPYGFGGIAALNKGKLPAEKIIIEHYRLGSTCAILSRSFCDVSCIKHMGLISSTFINGVRSIREFEREAAFHYDYFINNKENVNIAVRNIIEKQ